MSVFCAKTDGEVNNFIGVTRRHVKGTLFLSAILHNFRSSISVGFNITCMTRNNLLVYFCPFQEVSEIIRNLNFNDDEGIVVFRGIADAFPKATIQQKGIIQKCSLGSFHRYALVSVLRAVTLDGRIIAFTCLEEEINLNNRSLNCYKNSGIETFEVPIRKPVSDEDVGDVILISFGSKPMEDRYYIGVC